MPAVTRNPEPALGLVLHWHSSSILCCCRGSALFPSFATFPFAYCTLTHTSKLGVFICQNIIKYVVIHASLHVVIMGCNFRRWLCQHCLFIFIEWYFAVSDAQRRSFIQLWSGSDMYAAQATISQSFEENLEVGDLNPWTHACGTVQATLKRSVLGSHSSWPRIRNQKDQNDSL